MEFRRTINYIVSTEPPQDGLVLVDLIKEDSAVGEEETLDSFFVSVEDFAEMQKNGWVLFYFHELWIDHRNKFEAKNDMAGLVNDPEEDRLRELRNQRYRVWSDKFFEGYDTGVFHDPETAYTDIRAELAEKIDVWEVYGDIPLDHVGYLNFDNGLFYPFGSDTPRSPAYFIDYIGGVTSKEFNLKEAREILEDDDRVLEIRDEMIPHFNGGGDALQFFVRLPQDEYDELVAYCKERRTGHWSVHLKREFGIVGAKAGTDPLNLRPALKPEREDDDELDDGFDDWC